MSSRSTNACSVLFLLTFVTASCDRTPTTPSDTPPPATTQAPPTISALEPALGSSDGGTVIKVTGTGFTGVLSVLFGTTPARSFVVESETSISVTTPGGNPGTSHVTVSTQGGTSATDDVSEFRWDPNRLTDLSLSATSVAPGTSLQGTVSVTYPAPGGGIRLPLAVRATPPGSTAVLLPSSAVVPEGSTTTSFQIVTFYVSTVEPIEVVSEHWGERSATFTLTP
jgi:hypothetical protein